MCNSHMNKYEKRRLALLAVTKQFGRGGISRVASAIGKDQSYVSRMLYPEGKTGKKRIGEDSVDLLNEAFPNWEIGKANFLPADGGSNDSPGFTPLPDKKNLVTIARYETGGAMGHGTVLRDQPGIIESMEVSKEWLENNVRGFTSAGNLCVVTGFGDSMRPLFNPGDPLIIDAGVKTIEFDAVYFFRVGEEGFIKRLQRIPGQGLMAISENTAYRDWVIDKTMDFELLGRVLKVWCSEDF